MVISHSRSILPQMMFIKLRVPCRGTRSRQTSSPINLYDYTPVCAKLFIFPYHEWDEGYLNWMNGNIKWYEVRGDLKWRMFVGWNRKMGEPREKKNPDIAQHNRLPGETDTRNTSRARLIAESRMKWGEDMGDGWPDPTHHYRGTGEDEWKWIRW